MFRRQFLQTSGLLSLSPWVPAFVNHLAANTKPDKEQSILVVVELNGGNDGINTIVPHADPEYAKHRAHLKLDPKQLHKLSDEVGLHRNMRRCKELYDAGDMAIVQGVGYPNPNRSHFESLAIWHAGTAHGRRANGSGWIGEALDISQRSGSNDMDGYFVGRQSVSPAMVGRRAQVAALSRFEDMQLNRTIQPLPMPQSNADIASFVQRQVTDAYATARQIESISQNAGGQSAFPNSRLGQQMKIVSQLIKSGSAARVYYTVQGGYDTHSAQQYAHASLLSDLSNAIWSLVTDLKQSKLDDRVVVMAFSEFGRRVAENGSLGTDHGTAGPVILAGTSVKTGLHGNVPSLTDLDNGDLKTQFDFRQVYATLLERWLNISSRDVLGEQFELLPIV